jgi:HEAT repeat protein
VRLSYPAVLKHLADLMADAQATVRSAAATTIAYHGDEKGAHLLRLKLHHSDPEPEVITDTLKAYLSLDPAEGLVFTKRLLRGNGAARQGALSALGESRLKEALPLIVHFLNSTVDEDDIHVASLALGSLRTAEARAGLLERVATGSTLSATYALRGLTLFLGDSSVAEDARAALDRNTGVRLKSLFERLFDADSSLGFN